MNFIQQLRNIQATQKVWWIILALWIAVPLPAQHAAHSSSLSVVVDGSKDPELIPDDLAYRHFLLALAEHGTPTTEEARRREARLNPVGLSVSDHDELIDQLHGVREELDSIQMSRQSGFASQTLTESARTALFTSLRSREQILLDNAVASLRANLSSQGMAQLDAYVRGHVKAHITMLGIAEN